MNPEITVIIPTYNRSSILQRTIKSLCEKQSGYIPSWEIIVVNDGSTDETSQVLNQLTERYDGCIVSVYQKNQKQGAARNNAMRRAHGRLFIFLADDMIPDSTFLSSHWQRFVTDGQPMRYAAIGRVDWHPEIKETPFRKWINEWGLQFGFRLIHDPDKLPFNFFYTSNLALSRDLYDDLGGFDESFKDYGWEDIELGYRYMTNGNMRLRYVDDAITYHHHYLTVTRFCRRQFKVGYSSIVFYRLHPELRDFLKIKKISPILCSIKPSLWLATHIIEYCDEKFQIDLNPITELILKAYYELGMLQAQREFDSKIAI